MQVVVERFWENQPWFSVENHSHPPRGLAAVAVGGRRLTGASLGVRFTWIENTVRSTLV
jgi:hypothetical protein